MKKIKLPNGDIHPAHGGYRQILLDKQGHIRPVLCGAYAGPIGKRGTIQVEPQPGDVLLKVEWGRELTPEFSAGTFDGKRRYQPLHGEAYTQAWAMLHQMGDPYDEFLEPRKRGESWLPGIPDTEFVVNRAKLARVTEWIERLALPTDLIPDVQGSDKITRDWLRTPKGNLRFRPVEIDDAAKEVITGRRVDPETKTDKHVRAFVVNGHKGKNYCRELVEAETNRWAERFHMVIEGDMDPLAEYLPERWDLLVVLTQGAMHDDDGSYGFDVNVYRPLKVEQ